MADKHHIPGHVWPQCHHNMMAVDGAGCEWQSVDTVHRASTLIFWKSQGPGPKITKL